MSKCCELCGQPLPKAERRDPPLPPLPAPAVVTIHDLPEEERKKAKVKILNRGSACEVRQLVRGGDNA